MNTIGFEISPSEASNDHQVRIVIDGRDWLGDDALGIDPPDFFAQRALLFEGELLVGRCDCGCVGCGDVIVQARRHRDCIRWSVSDGTELSFAASQYDNAIDQAKSDFSWEDTNRTAERLATSVLAGLVLNDGFQFEWASTRVRKGCLSLSFVQNGVQKVIDLEWEVGSPESARTSAIAFLKGLSK